MKKIRKDLKKMGYKKIASWFVMGSCGGFLIGAALGFLTSL